MTQITKSRMVSAGFGLALLLAALVAFIAYQQGSENVAAARWVAHTYDVQRQLALTLSTVQDVVIGARGYTITGKDEFLEPFQKGQTEIPKQIQALRKLTGANSEQQPRIEFLESLIARRIEISQENITLRQTKGPEAAQAAVSGGEGKRVMDQIRKVIEEMESAESALLKQRTERLQASNLRVLGVFIAMLVLLAVLLLATLFYVRRDVAAREREKKVIQDARAYAENIVDTVRESLLVLDADLRLKSANRSFYQAFQVTPQETNGALFFELGNCQWNIPSLRNLLEEILPQNSHFYDFEVEHDFPAIGRRTMLLNARKTYREGNNTQSILLAIEDITDRKRAEEALRRSEKWLSTTLGSIGDAVIATDQNGSVTFLNPVAQDLTGWTQEEAQGKSLDLVFDIINRETRQPVENPVKKVFRAGKVVGLADHTVLISKDRREFDIEDSAAPIVTGEGERIGVVLVFRDVTETKKTEEERNRIFDLSMDMICVAGFDGYFKQLNPAWEKTLGFTVQELLAKPYLEFIHPEDRERTASEAKRQAGGKNAISFENRYLCKDGSYKWLLWNATPLPASQLIYAVAHDISERKQAEETLRQSELRYRLFFESNPHPVWVYDMESLAFLNVNAAAVRQYGYSREEFLSMTIKDIRPAQDVPALLSSVQKAAFVVEMTGNWVHRKKNGTLIDVEIASHKLVYLGREARLVVVTDVTAAKRASEALQASEEQLRSVVETASDAVISADGEGRIIYFNPAAQRIFGYGATEVVGQPLSILMPERFHEAHRAGFKRYLSTGEAHVIGKTVELAGKRKDGTEFPVELSLASWKTKDGIFFTGILSDITERKRAEAALLRAKDEAERGSKFKDQFLSTMSHELRTPLNAVLGFSELLADDRYGALNDKQRRYVGHIHSGGQHLLKLINDILDLSKIEAGRLELAFEEVPVATAFAEVLSALRPLAEKKSQSLVQECIENLAVRADSMRFKQILMNLLGNAIKFTPEGGRIELAARAMDSKVRVEVRDTGPGIPPEEQKRIFESFYRLRQSGQSPEGTGLGLAITQRLVELHGGELGLESQPGQGSCFFFSLPALAGIGIAPVRDRPVEKADGVPKILVIEDDPTAAHLIDLQLSASGYEPVICDQPQRAVDLAAELQPRAITLDLLMGPVNGWELLLQLKADARTREIPVIVLTIVDQPGMGMVLGADEYLIKPVEQETLLAAIERCIGTRKEPGMRPILVVEDDAATREVIAELLRSQGYSVSTAEDGAQARATVEASLPALVILDLLLPKVSGFELLSEWRASPRTADLPVFVLTSKDLTRDEENLLRAQAETVLLKKQPWREDLLKQLHRAVPLSPAGKT